MLCTTWAYYVPPPCSQPATPITAPTYIVIYHHHQGFRGGRNESGFSVSVVSIDTTGDTWDLAGQLVIGNMFWEKHSKGLTSIGLY